MFPNKSIDLNNPCIVAELTIDGNSKKIDGKYGKINVGMPFLKSFNSFPAELIEVDITAKFKNTLNVVKTFEIESIPYTFTRLGDFVYLVETTSGSGYLNSGEDQYKILIYRVSDVPNRESVDSDFWTLIPLWKYPEKHYPHVRTVEDETKLFFIEDHKSDLSKFVYSCEYQVDKRYILIGLFTILHEHCSNEGLIIVDEELFSNITCIEWGTMYISKESMLWGIEELIKEGNLERINESTILIVNY